MFQKRFRILVFILIGFIFLCGWFQSDQNFIQAVASWSFVDGGTATGINYNTSRNASNPTLTVFNNEIYAAWEESNGSVNQIRVKKSNGSSWSLVCGANGLNKDSSKNASHPVLIVFNSNLYAAWDESNGSYTAIRVRRFDGGTTWTQVDGDLTQGLNRGMNAALNPFLAVFNDELYLAWEETISGVSSIHVKKYVSGTTWSFVDGNTTAGLNHSNSYNASAPNLTVCNSQFYIGWAECNGSGIKQIRARRYDGGGTWTSIDGNGANGLNLSTSYNANAPWLMALNNTLYAAWNETNSSGYELIHLKLYNGSTWSFVDSGYLNRVNTLNAYSPKVAILGYSAYISWDEQGQSPSLIPQIRVKKYTDSTYSFIDGGTASSQLNYNNSKTAKTPYPVIFNGDLYVSWYEEGSSYKQIRVKKYPLPAVVTSVTVPANGTYLVGQNLDFVVNFNKAVNVTGTSLAIPVTLNSGGIVNAAYVSGSGTSALTFRYTIINGTSDPDGVVVGSSISLYGCTIRDTVNNLDADVHLYNLPSTSGVLVEGTVPTSSSFSPSNGMTTVLTNANLIIWFSESVAKGTGNVKIYRYSDDFLVESINVSGTNVTVSYNCVTVDPTVTLEEFTHYYIKIGANAFEDTAGNHYAGISTKGAWHFTTKDSTPPSGYSVDIEQPYINNNNKTDMHFTFAGAEVGATYNYTLSSTGGGGPLTGSGTITSANQHITGVTTFGLNEGTLTLSVTLTDTGSNTGAPATDTVIKDTLMPTGYSVHFDGPINNSNKTSASFTFTGAEIGASFYFSINSSGGGASIISSTVGWFASSSTQQVTLDFSGLADGTLTLTFRMTDAAGNIGGNVTNTGAKDTVAPGGYSVNINPASINSGNQTMFSFTFAGAEVGAAYDYTISSSGGGTPVAYDGIISSANQTVNGIDVSGLNDGTLTLSVILSDEAGNSGLSVTDTVIKDATAPSGYNVSINNAYIRNSNKANLSFTLTGAEIGTMYSYHLTSSGGGSEVEGTGNVTSATQIVTGINTTPLNDGTLTLQVCLVDTFGNTGSSVTDTVLRDTVAPGGYTVGINQSYINSVNKTDISFNFVNAAEVGATCNYSVSSSGGGTTVTGSAVITTAYQQITGIDVSGLNDGVLSLSVTLRDIAGNTGEAAADTAEKNTVLPFIQTCSLASSNGYMDLSFNKGVYGSSNGVDPLNAGNLSLTFTRNGGTATGMSITGVRKADSIVQGSASPLSGGETIVRVFFSISGTPSGVETVEVKCASGNRFYDVYGNPASMTSLGALPLNDKLAPTMVDAVRTNNTHITVHLSESCANLTKANDGGFTVQEYGSATTYPISATAQGAEANQVILTVANVAVSGREGLIVKYTAGGNGTVQDNVGNIMATNSTGVIVTAWDIVAPTITSATLASSNGYLDLIFSEGVYSADDGTGGLITGDFSLTFAANGGNATNATISSITKSDGTALTGGEATIRVVLSVTGTPSGVETIEIQPASSTAIYDRAGNPVAASETTGTKSLNDMTIPTLVSAVRTDNTHLVVTLSENCTNINTANDGGFRVNETGDAGVTYAVSAISQGVDASHVVLTLANVGPSGDVGIKIRYTAGTNGTIQDMAGNAMASSSAAISIPAWDTSGPAMVSAARTNNAHITVTLSEECLNLVNANNGGFTVGETGSGLTYAVTATAQGADATQVILTVANMSVSAREGVTVIYTEGGTGIIQDLTGHTMATDSAGVLVAAWDTTPPMVTSCTLDASNGYMDFVFNEGLYSADNGTTGLTAADFKILFVPGSGTATNVAISSVKKNDSAVESSASALTGGETTVRVFLTVTGTPGGVEYIEVGPVDVTAIYDKAGNAISDLGDSTAQRNLYDKLAPTLISATRTDNTHLVVTLSENCTNIDKANNGGFTVNQIGNATITYAVTAIAQGVDASHVVLTVANIGASGAAGVKVRYTAGTNGTIQDNAGNAIAAGGTGLNILAWDTTGPAFVGAVRTNNTHITVTLSEDCVNLTQANNGGFMVCETGSATTYAVTATAMGVNSSQVVLTVANMAVSAKEGVTVKYTTGGNGIIQDVAGNAMATDGTGVSIAAWDLIAPTIISSALDVSNGYIDLVFSEGVYGADNGTSGLTAGDFVLGFTSEGGNATNATIISVKKNDNTVESLASSLAGSETTIRVFLTVTGTPNGVETIEITPADGASIYDKAGNAVSASQTTGVKTLNDKLAPTLVSVVRTDNTHLTVTLSEDCIDITKVNDGGFTVNQVGSSTITYVVTAITQGVDARHVVLTVADISASAGYGVKVKYTTGVNGTIQDVAGNVMATDTTGLKIPSWGVA